MTTSTHERRPVWSKLRASAVAAAPALLVFAILRILSLVTLVQLASAAHRRDPDKLVFWDGSHDLWRGWTSAMDVLLAWDGRWYVLLAAEGYAGPIGEVDANGIGYHVRVAFFPLYPYLARGLAALPLISPVGACLLISAVASLAAAWSMFAIGERLRGRRFGLMLAALWAVAPANLAENGAFTESLFTALSGWGLYAVLTRRWLAAGALAALAGLTRPTGLVLVATVGLAAVVAVVQRADRWRRGEIDGSGPVEWRPIAAMVLAPLGYLSYLGYAADRLGGTDQYYDLHHYQFGAYFDYGASTLEVITHLLLGVGDEQDKPVRVLSVLLVFAAIVLTVLAVLERIPWVLVVFTVVMLVLSVGSHAHISQFNRHILPAFPILVVPAALLAGAPTRVAAVLLPALAVLSAWYGSWLPFISGQAI